MSLNSTWSQASRNSGNGAKKGCSAMDHCRTYKLILSNLTAAILLFCGTSALGQSNTDFSYFAPGNILPVGVHGINKREVVSQDWTFPLQVGTITGLHAYIGTQLSQYHGLNWNNDPRLFHYPSRDNQCEPRDWTVTQCPSGKGHQGVDIRANDNSNNKWNVIAVEDGIVTTVTSNTTVAVKHGARTVRYLHMDMQSIREAGIKIGSVVHKGQALGHVSNIMEGTPSTSFHLHFDAYTGTAAAGNFYHVYPALIAAYRRAWGLPDNVDNGILEPDPVREIASGGEALPTQPDRPVSQSVCQNVSLSTPLPEVDRDSFVSLWQHNCSIMGMIANEETGERRFVYFQPKQSIAGIVRADPVFFIGKNDAGTISGVAKLYSSRCGTISFPASGSTSQASENPVVVLRGQRPQRDSETCKAISTTEEKLEFTFLERVSPDVVISGPDLEPRPERSTLSEITRNFLAITFYPNDAGKIDLLPYFARFPGLVEAEGKKDSKGGLIPALSSDEGGVAISWVWINKRALYTDGLLITPKTVAYSMAGVDPQACDMQMQPTASGVSAIGSLDEATSRCNAVTAYLMGYIGFAGGRNFAADYFGRQLKPDETLDMNNPIVAWNWMRTMYSHESGHPVVIDRDTFHRGVAFGKDYIESFYDGNQSAIRAVAFYSDPCNFAQLACKRPAQENSSSGGGQKPTELLTLVAALREQVSFLAAENKKLQSIVGQLKPFKDTKRPKKIDSAGGNNQRRPLY
ncbi:M23 family metallopeptidase [Rhizobium sophoriradicis]|uniref:M23 family metallopeptidase n=1 Tax=Rhizobium sophoriradicis TaxID=1535245 RepID=UPI0015CE1F6E|nr:M23 family metallopeptidase [Rhizobium sophoriradicis]